MGLRKPPPPRLENLTKWSARPELPSSTSSPTSAPSPRRAHLNRLPSQESVYSPDLNTSPAFDLMPLEEAQKSPAGSLNGQPPTSRPEGPGNQSEYDRSAAGKSEWHPPVLVPGSQQTSAPLTTSEVPVQLQSNNPFLKPRPQEPSQDLLNLNDWNDRQSHATTNSDPLSQSMVASGL